MQYRSDARVVIPLKNVQLIGELMIPLYAKSIIIFSHGSGSSHLSPRNKMVAKTLQSQNIGTLLFDLLTPKEDVDYQNRFDIELLTQRLKSATEWLMKLSVTGDCRLGYFGASTGAAAALKASVDLPEIEAVVARGGRTDMVMDILHKVSAPTLLIVGSLDKDVLRLNQEAYSELLCEKRLSVIDGASHLFEEEGTMSQVCDDALKWFRKHLSPFSTLATRK